VEHQVGLVGDQSGHQAVLRGEAPVFPAAAPAAVRAAAPRAAARAAAAVAVPGRTLGTRRAAAPCPPVAAVDVALAAFVSAAPAQAPAPR